jgi:hypothetical protein
MRIADKRLPLFACATAAAALATAILLFAPRPAAATAKFAMDTGKSCADCHTAATGGGPLTALGEKFKENGNKLPK